jgi:hypothetical protein
MMVYPQRPDGTAFEAAANILAARAHVQALYEAALPGFASDSDRIEFPKKIGRSASDYWKNYKEGYGEIQGGRCAYCEMKVIGGQPGDVEHYRPKGELEILDPANQGEEREHLSNVVGRRALRAIGTGYWWDAYSWENYLLSCDACNRGWKRNFFPIAGDPAARQRPARNVAEQDLLFNPFGSENPADHFSYDLDGLIHGLTEMGVATIETVGLWRPSLVTSRREVLHQLQLLIEDIVSEPDDVRLLRTLKVVLRQGGINYPFFPGMIRIYFSQQAGMSWDVLEQKVAELEQELGGGG